MLWKMNYPEKAHLRSVLRNIIAAILFSFFTLVSCRGQAILETLFPKEFKQLESLQPSAEPTQLIFPTQEITMTPSIFIDLVMWVPPQFDPNGDGESARYLKGRIQDFLKENPEVNLEVRVKAATGPGGILDTLTSTATAAPNALPSIVLMTRTDMRQAVERNLVYPMETTSSAIDESDWYEFAKEMGILQGTVYGLPFASNILGLVYRGEIFNTDQPTWNEVFSTIQALDFPGGDPEALLSLSLYLSTGGALQDHQGQIMIESDKLVEVLDLYAKGLNSGVITPAAADWQTDDQAWMHFERGELDAVVTWANRQTSDSENLNIALLPTLSENSYSIATGWLWCLTRQDENHQNTSAKLAEYLITPEFLTTWTPVSGFLPVRPSSITNWPDSRNRDTLQKMLLSAHYRPDREKFSQLSLEIRTAVVEVLTGQNTPEGSVNKILERMEVATQP